MATSSIPPVSGIYKITCTANGRIYIGSSVNCRTRWRDHRVTLRKGVHRNVRLQNAWNKYSESDFIFEILELVMPWGLIDREQYWLDKLKSYEKSIGFNINTKAESSYGRECKPETRAKISAAQKGKKHSLETRAMISEAGKNRKQSTETKEKRARSRRLEYIVTTPTGVEIKIKGLAKFCLENDLSQAHMSDVANGKRRHHKGWKVRRVES